MRPGNYYAFFGRFPAAPVMVVTKLSAATQLRPPAKRPSANLAFLLRQRLVRRIKSVKVFFYGLFMDKGLLAEKGIIPSKAVVGYVDGFGLRIGERATLLRSPNARAYGVVMDISPSDVKNLYSESSVADYVPEPVTVECTDGHKIEASCFNLPNEKVTGTNKAYAKALLEVARKLRLPDSYVDEISQAEIG